MKISLDWLKQYVKWDESPTELMDIFNNIGLVVDDWEEEDGDIILDMETYANRPDTLGHLGVARELAVALGKKLNEENWPLIENREKTETVIDIQIHDEVLCPRYCGLVVKDIEVGPSPEWLVRRIRAMGLNPVNNVVDVTNYVLFSTAQPIHAFDLSQLEGAKIIVRRANKGEIFETLDGKDLTLSNDMLVIADERKPVALAGVIGGKESAVTEKTHDVFIESACFSPVSIRKTAKELGIQTDASYRFERGTDISMVPRAALMAASILTQMGGKATKGIFDVYPKPRKKKTLILRKHRINDLLGVDILNSEIEGILKRLEFDVACEQDGLWRILVPFHRVDIEREADLIEEIARFYGYNKIPASLPPQKSFEPPPSPVRKTINKIRNILFHYGFNEVVNFSFMGKESGEVFLAGMKPVEIRNPVSSKTSIMRTSLLPGLLETVAWNMNRGNEGVHIFEIGKIYFWKNEETIEQQMLAILSSGLFGTLNWQTKPEETDVFRLKGACEDLLYWLRFEPVDFQKENHPFFEPEYSLQILVKGQPIGFLGLLKEEIRETFSLKHKVWAAELNLKNLLDKQVQAFKIRPIGKLPPIVRDISFLADENHVYQEIVSFLRNKTIPHLEDIELYDRFVGTFLPKGKVSLSFRLVFRHPQRTLTSEEADDLVEKIIKMLKDEFDFQLREGGKIDN